MHTTCPIVDVAALERAANSRPSVSLQAEITGEASYYLLNTWPGEDMRALRWLARRRFGVWRPMQQRKVGRVEGQSIGQMEPILPGWLLIFCWDIDGQRSRIESCPGVMGIVCDTANRPITLSDQFVQTIRAVSLDVTPDLGRPYVQGRRNERRVRRASKRERRAIDGLKRAVKARGIVLDADTEAQLKSVDPAKKINILSRSLERHAAAG